MHYFVQNTMKNTENEDIFPNKMKNPQAREQWHMSRYTTHINNYNCTIKLKIHRGNSPNATINFMIGVMPFIYNNSDSLTMIYTHEEPCK